MPYAVTLRLDADAAAKVERLLAAVAAEDPIDYGPHVTLAVYSDNCNVEELRRVIETLVPYWPTLAIEFAALGVFLGADTVLWVAPAVTAELLRRHAELVAELPAGHRHYRLGSWVPHVTLAQFLTGAGAASAIAALEPIWQPFSGTVDRVEIVHFAPVEVLASWPLN